MGISDMWGSIAPGTSGRSGRRKADELEDGTYTVAVREFRYWMKEGEPDSEQFRWGLEVVEGLNKGKYVEKYSRASQVGLSILAEDLTLILGKMPTSDEVYNRAENVAGLVVGRLVGATILMRQVTNKKGYANFYFNEVVEDEFAADEPTPEADDDDDIPF